MGSQIQAFSKKSFCIVKNVTFNPTSEKEMSEVKKFPYEIKSAMDMPVLDVDTEKRRVKVAFSMIGNVDLDQDVTEYGAFDKTWAERGPEGKDLIWHLVDHVPRLTSNIGKPKELGYDQNYAFGITPITDTTLGNDVLKMYIDGIVNQHSYGFAIPKNRSEERDGVRYIKEVMQFEYSSVLWGANESTPTLELMKSIPFEEQKTKLSDRLEKLLKGWKHGTYTDDTFSLLEIEIKQIQSKILELSTLAAPIPEAPAPPIENELLKALKETNERIRKIA